MPLDPYVSCPCGSGKKFKWCCAGYYDKVEKAFDQAQRNQDEAALQTILDLTKSHPGEPAVWGYYAQFLYNSGQAEKAEEALSEALRLNPNFGMAFFLRGMFRQNEGELIGSLMLFRKAAEAYDPEAHDQLAHVHELIFRAELMLNRPVAARAALERVVHFMPADPEVREQFEALFGNESRLPQCARKAYSYRPTAKPVAANAATGRLSDAKKAFEDLTKVTPDDPAAWFDLGLTLAWLGDQPKAVEALNTSVELEPDDRRAEEAAALASVLRCGHGMEADADYVEYGYFMQIRDPNAVMGLLRDWDAGRRLLGVQSDQQTGTVSGMVVEELPSLLAVGSTTLAKVSAKITLSQGIFRVWHPNKESAAKVAEEVRTKVNLAVEQPQEVATPINLGDVALEAVAYPTQTADIAAAEEKLRGHAQNFFEEVWVHRPLKSLGGNSPLNAVGSKIMRKRTFGAVKFVEDCFTGIVPHKRVGQAVVPITVYDFDQLRHKLGLGYVAADPPKVNVPAEKVAEKPAAPAPAAPAKREISAMNAGELASLDVAAASADELEQAIRAAVKLDARELAVAFAQAGVQKPFDAAKPDRYAFYATLITGALSEGDTAKALKFANDGAWYDGERNGNKRATEYGLRKAQLYAKLKDVDSAVTEFEALIALHPDEGKYYTGAAEEMLRLKAGAKALAFAEKGLAKARETKNRDLEGHCQELVAAAKKAT
ncbi:MAG TPA: tetratricopeptide repeat protein [Gemmataceae bacterium]|nr:tetratricopeptide repeat protein [Gemmataceae bacterium]